MSAMERVSKPDTKDSVEVVTGTTHLWCYLGLIMLTVNSLKSQFVNASRRVGLI